MIGMSISFMNGKAASSFAMVVIDSGANICFFDLPIEDMHSTEWSRFFLSLASFNKIKEEGP